MKKILHILLGLNLFALQSYLIRFELGPYPSNLQEILIGALALVFLVHVIQTKKLTQTLRNIRKRHIIIVLAALTTLSALIVPIEQFIDYVRHLKFLFFASVLTFVALEILDSKEKIRQALTTAGIGAIIFGIFSVTYNLAGYNSTFDFRLLGPLDSAVYLAYYFAPFFIFFTLEFINDRQKRHQLLYAIILGLMLIATRSMGAIGGSFIAIFGYLFLQKRQSILKSKTAITALIIAAITIIAAIFYLKILPTLNTTYSSLDERGEIWRTAFYMLQEPKNLLLGVGFGQFEHHYIQSVQTAINNNPLDYYVIQPHNIFLLFTFHYGILGLAFILLVMTKTAKNLFTQKDHLTIVTGLMLTYFFIHGMIDTPFFKNDIMIILILLMEISLTQLPGLSKQRKDPQPS